MSRPFVDDNDNYHPEAIIAFGLLVASGCLMGFLIAIVMGAF